MTTNTANLTLYGEQHTILQDWLNTDKNCMDIVPVGSGKTFLASVAIPIMASDKRYHKGKDIVYFAPTREMIKTLIWEGLKRSCIEYFGLQEGRDINNSDLTIKFPSGIYIRCKSAEQKENLRGMNIGVAFLDEAALFSEESLLEITNRLRPRVGDDTTEGRMIVISTPNGANALYTLFKNAITMPDRWIVRHLTYEQMRSGNRKFIEQQRRLLSPLKFAKDYLCAWESVEDKFFMAWNKTMCAPVVDQGGDLYTFHDWNKKRMCAVVAQVRGVGNPDDKIEVLKAYAIPNCSTEQLARAIREDYPQRNIHSIIDVSGGQLNRDTTSTFGVTDRTIIEQFGFRVVNNVKSNPRVSDTDNSSNAFIARGGLVVDPDNTLLLEALDNFHYEDASRIKLVKYSEQQFAHIDGLGDCIRYGIHHLFPLQHSGSGLPDYQTNDPRFIKIPGSQYLKQSPLYPGGPTIEEIIRGDSDDDSDYVTW